MARPNLQLQLAHSPVLRYGLAATSFAIALGLALPAQRYGFHNVEVPLFRFAVAVSAWYAGSKPAVLASLVGWFSGEPRLNISGSSDLQDP